MFEIKGLVKYYGPNRGIDGLDLCIDKGEIAGLIGTNGSGKTTTFRVLLGLLEPDQGTVRYDNKPLSAYDNRLLGYLPEDRSVYRDLRVDEQIRFLSRLKGLDEEQIRDRMDRWLQRLAIAAYRQRKIKELSKGNQQKVQMICALIHDPQIIILDEPLTGLDIVNVNLFKQVIDELKQAGKLILLSSHQYEYIEEFCDKIVLLDQGSMIYQGRVTELKRSAAYRYLAFMSEHPQDYLTCDGVMKQFRSGNVIRLEMVNEVKAKKLMRQLLRDPAILYLKFELPTIGDIMERERSV